MGVPKSLKDPHIASVLRPLGPHIARGFGDPGPRISSDMVRGPGVPILGGPDIARTQVFFALGASASEYTWWPIISGLL